MVNSTSKCDSHSRSLVLSSGFEECFGMVPRPQSGAKQPEPRSPAAGLLVWGSNASRALEERTGLVLAVSGWHSRLRS